MVKRKEQPCQCVERREAFLRALRARTKIEVKNEVHFIVRSGIEDASQIVRRLVGQGKLT